MTRTADLAPPTLTPHPLPPDSSMATWPAQLRIGLELLPQPAYTWDDPDDAVTWDATTAGVPGYLTPTVGTVSTPDPGPLPNECTFVFKVRSTSTTAGQSIASQFATGGQWSWDLEVSPAEPNFIWIYSTDGSAIGSASVSVAVGGAGPDQWRALTVTATGLTAWTSDDGVTWTVSLSTSTSIPSTFDSSSPVRVGGSGIGAPFAERIYSFELRTGLDPAAGTVRWRFDADDYPGTGTSYTDPRGRTWTLTTAAAITPKVPGDPVYVWDAPFVAAGFTDALCDLHALTIDPGEPDELGLFPAVETTLTLANPVGAYTPWTADGRLVYWAPGRRLAVWAHLDGADWWLFSGRVARWDVNADDTVTVSAFDGFANLADELGADWTPGTAAQTPLARIQAIAAQVGYIDPIDGDVGDTPLSTAVTDHSPLEECQRAALSDGGVFAGDADGRLVYRNRLWRAGRADQTVVPVFSDNVCTVPAVVWDAELTAADDGLYNRVELVNAAGLTAVAAAPPGDPASWYGTGLTYRLTHPDPDLWQTQGAGDALAAYLLAQQSTPKMGIRTFTLHLIDPLQELWQVGIDLRRGDRVRFLHDFRDAAGAPATLDVVLIVTGVRHEVTPDTWSVHVSTSRTVDYLTVEEWDRTLWVWDDPDPDAVWRF